MDLQQVHWDVVQVKDEGSVGLLHADKYRQINQIYQTRTRNQLVINITVSSGRNVRKKECEKLEKYEGLNEELEMWEVMEH